MIRILIADDEPAARFGLRKALAGAEHELVEAADGPAALEAIQSQLPDLVFLDLNMPGLEGRDVLRKLGPAARDAEIVIVTANDSVAAAVECLHLGAADYVTKPYEIEQLRAIARRVASRVELQRRVDDLQARLGEAGGCGALVGVSRPMRLLFEQIARAAKTPPSLCLLVRGETGTGKELVAREIHRQSDRAAGPFIAVNTAAIAESLAESELFGHVKGAFTGAAADRAGVFEQAHGGTLFLDEIGDMPLPAQAKILRTLQERTVQPIGSSRQVPVDVRVICATHQDLEAAVSEKHFRQDLYFRVRGLELHIPPLRNRREDILPLAQYFWGRCEMSPHVPGGGEGLGVRGGRESDSPRLQPLSRRERRGGKCLAPDAIDRLLTHTWPGNVRELEHVVTAAAAMASGDEIRAVDLPLPGGSAIGGDDGSTFAAYLGLPLTEAKNRLVDEFERATIGAALEQHRGNISAAARQLGIHRQSLQQKMAQLGMRRAGNNLPLSAERGEGVGG
jgi:DNA-binding NtrC family response regulator